MRLPHAALGAVPQSEVDELARVMFIARYDREPVGTPESYEEVLVREFRALARHTLAWLRLEGRIDFGGEPPAAARALREAVEEWKGGPTGAAPIPGWWLLDRAARIEGECTCGWGGTHDPDNPHCEANRP